MGPIGHTVISSGVGVGVGIATGSPEAGALALGVGVLMDIDHVFDFYRWYVGGKPDQVVLVLHAWEYSLAGLVAVGAVAYHPLFLALVLAHLAHVATDHFHNGLPPLTYFMSYRIAKRFATAEILPGYNVMLAHKTWPKMLPYGRKLLPWYQRRVEPWFEERVIRAQVSQATLTHSDD